MFVFSLFLNDIIEDTIYRISSKKVLLGLFEVTKGLKLKAARENKISGDFPVIS